jgi:uncharacterized membrane protein YhaH (DUF805 family)
MFGDESDAIGESGYSTGAIIAMLVLAPLLVYCGLAIGAKRWHDRNKSGWWNLIGFIPYIGSIWQFVECGSMRGTHGSNNYGGDPT